MLESSKYNVIWKSASEPSILTNSDCEYASFLKNLERTCNKSGYLDSDFYTHQHKSKNSDSADTGLTSTIATHPYEVAKYRAKFTEDYEKHMKKISRALLEEKRKERILKRHEGDIIKKEHVLNKSLYEFDSEINSKKFKQDLLLNKTAGDLDKIHKKFYYDKSKSTRERMRQSVSSNVEKMGKSRQSNLNLSKLLREFNAKKMELDVNSQEISKLMKDFEIHLAREENKHKKLQNELEIYTKALQREILKNQTQNELMQKETLKQQKQKEDEDKQLDTSLSLFLNNSDNGIKASELERKVLDGQLNSKTTDHSVKMCEYGGSLNTIRNKLRECENTQRQLIENANYFNLVLKNAETKQKIEVANSKKMEMGKTTQDNMISSRLEKESKYLNLSKNREVVMELENETENVGHLKDVIRRDKENEKKYFKNMNDASKDIKQLSMVINRLSKKLHDTMALNSSRINEEKRNADRYEQELEEELNILKTNMIELQAKRNNYSSQLIECRKYLQGDQYYLSKSEYNRSRLSNIKKKTDENQSFLPIVI